MASEHRKSAVARCIFHSPFVCQARLRQPFSRSLNCVRPCASIGRVQVQDKSAGHTDIEFHPAKILAVMLIVRQARCLLFRENLLKKLEEHHKHHKRKHGKHQ
jgi:hypothetical protein